MEVSRRRLKHLKPARPLRRLNVDAGDQLCSFAECSPDVYTPVQLEPDEKPLNRIEVEHYEILNMHSKNHVKTKEERISYTREFLIQMAYSPMSKRRPDFLPEHPVVLENARDNDVRRLIFSGGYAEKEESPA
ncbi:uncharacterized protein C8orf88 homolog [Denticeps clupeoides]|uniref:uncharacterized protein C8orf88 homolog n=1 Tax=Denticeps clupeoides TaxID=299321 RepID=UPI0010A431BC|nr:uncharacterized protein C8orf88 homolog [Denticeps clupeoides]XP_028843062.1 uncharacterized protein C8orf88 homolog [Denticeps clupeoides]